MPSDALPFTVFILGAGIQENSWAPVCAAIEEVAPHAGIGTDSTLANFYLAQHVYHLRFAARFKDRFPEGEAAMRERDIALKNAIARRLDSAVKDGTLRLRERFIKEFNGGPWGPRLVLTLNWDRLLEVRYGFGGPDTPRTIAHIHGDTQTPQLMYLPSEITPELHRTEDDHNDMARKLGTLWRQVATASKVVIYGCSVSPLDAELAYGLAVGLSEHKTTPCELFIYDVQKELDGICRRARMFLSPESKVKFTLTAVD